MRFIAPFASQTIVGQTIVGWAIRKVTSIRGIARENNNSLIGKKPPNPVGTKEEN